MHLEEHARCRHECLFDADARLCRRFKESVEAFFAGKLFAFRSGHLPVLLLVLLVGDEENQRVCLALVLNLLKPV